MLKLTGAQIRAQFIAYFRDRLGHAEVSSASLIPSNPTVLLTPAGMLPFVPVFLGIEPAPNPPRAVSSQKCARVSGKASDLSYVGRTPRHHTFFEMLGNFSFGDYFKADVIPWAWAFITEVLQLPKERLYVTVYDTDDEAAQIWRDKAGVPAEGIFRKGKKDNFWGPPGPTGPCGPCTEIFWDMAPDPAQPVNGDILDTDRCVEIWNLVFMELFQDAQGHTAPLEKKNVDTGMGLERIAMVVQGVDNTFETDLLFPLVKRVADMTGTRYKTDAETDVALKIVADHMRCVAFALADGITPSNEGRGYVIRMILRRAVRYAKTLGAVKPLLFKLVSTIRDMYQDAYPELKQRYELIAETVKAEEKRFLDTLERGSRLLEDAISAAKARGETRLAGEDVFKLYDTYGFPIELTEELATEAGLGIDAEGFEQAMTGQKETARAAQAAGKTIVSDQVFAGILRDHGPTHFMGYDALDAEGTVVALILDGQPVDSVGGTNQPFELVLDHTPFYGESGGQVGDQGILYRPGNAQNQTVVVRDTRKVGELFVHHCLFDQGGSLSVGETLRGEVNPDARARTARHHSATHLLHAALKQILGQQVSQAGSYVGPDGARFDFNSPKAMSPEEVQQTEMTVNRWVLLNTEREVVETGLDEAKASGAVAMFGEKYGATVRMVRFGQASLELCGGTHVERLGDVGLFKITSEGAVAAGVRRIEFVAGELALHAMARQQSLLQQAAAALKIPAPEVPERVEKLLADRKELEKQLRQSQEQLALGEVKRLLAEQTGGTIIAQVQVADADVLKWMAETLQRQAPESLVFLAANIGGKAQLLAAVPQAWQAKGFKAGDLVKQAAALCEGGGGGKPQFAQAGGKAGHKVNEAVAWVQSAVKQMA